MDRDFRLAELENEPDALRAIRQLEEQLKAKNGSEIALIAYSVDEKDEERQG